MTNAALPIDAARRALAVARDQWGGEIDGGMLRPISQQLSELASLRLVDEIGKRFWYVLLIEPLHEFKAAAHLVGRRFRVYLPTVTGYTTRGARRTKVAVQQPMLRGYLPINLGFECDERRLTHIRNAPGVHKFMQLGESFATIPDAEMERLLGVEESLAARAKAKGQAVNFEVGETVRVCEGPFTGFTAQIIETCKGERIRVSIAFMRRAVKTLMPLSELEKL